MEISHVPTESTQPARHRFMIAPDEALQLVLAETSQLPSQQRSLYESVGLALAEPVAADRDQPPFDRAMMDGYAVAEGAAGKRLHVVGQVAAGHAATLELRENQCVEIMTGAACPPGTVAVVPKEQVSVAGNHVTFPAQIAPGQYMAPRGSELREGEVKLREGDRIDPLAVAALACFGRTTVRVVRPPRVTIVTTGTEVVSPESVPGPAQIRDGNGPMLYAMARGAGVEYPHLVHAADRIDSLVDSIGRQAGCDVLILTGGVSAGRFDLVPDAIRQVGAEILFHKVRQKPGKPLLFARLGQQLIFGLPGNPLASHFCFHRYVGSALRRMQGREPHRPILQGQLAQTVSPDGGRTHYVLGNVDRNGGATPQIRPFPGKNSADVFCAVAPDCYLEIPPGQDAIPAGTLVSFTRLDGV